MNETVIVVGASRGFGAATADALTASGYSVVGVARSWADSQVGEGVRRIGGDARDADLAQALLLECQPSAIVVGGGAIPHMAPLESQTFDTLSIHWNYDVAIAFTWLKAVLSQPTEPLRTVAVISSGAGLFGSPGSGGYAGAKATTRFLTASAADSAKRLNMSTRFVSVNPKLTSATGVGLAAATGYGAVASDGSVSVPDPIYTADHAGKAIAGLVSSPDDYPKATYMLAEGGLKCNGETI